MNKPKRSKIPTVAEGDTSTVYPFSEEDYWKVIVTPKTHQNAAGINTNQLLNFIQHIEDGYHRSMLSGLHL